MTLKCVSLIIALVAGCLASPLAAEAQQAVKVPRIGYLSGLPRSAPLFQQNRQAFLQGMREHGYLEGQTIAIEWRFAEGRSERLPELAAGLVRLKVDLIVAEATPAARAAKEATLTIPIVIPDAADAVGSGLVASLARPAGNVTGLSFLGPELVGKRLQVLKDVVPGMTRLAVLWHPGLYGEATVKVMSGETEIAARAFGVRLQRVEARNPDDLVRAFGAMTGEKTSAVVLWTSPMFFAERRRIVDLAAKNRLPAVYPWREAVDDGGLMSYGPNAADLFRRAAGFVDKILKGARPGDLPVEQPTKFELVINLKTVKTLGLSLSPSILARADEVIQ